MTKKILILPGDGIGQEVTSSAKEVLDFLIDEYQLNFEITNMDVGGTAYEKFGSPLPDNVLEEAKKSDAILFGAVGGPQWDDLGWDYRPEQALLGLRKELELFANLRPAFLFNELASASPIKNHIIENLDILIVRELTGGVYFGEPRAIVLDDPTPYAFNTMIYNEDEIRRIAKVAFESAQKRNGKLCSVEKANVLEVSKFWRSIVSDMAKDYPDVELTHQLADNTAMQLVLNPNQFDVIVSGNLFGDILSITSKDIYWIFSVMVVVIFLLFINWKKLLLLTLNEELAKAEGVNKTFYELLFMFLIALAVSVSVQIVGVLLITSLLIIPPAIARVFSNSPIAMIFSSMIISIVSVLLGLYTSITFDLATGPAIVITLGVFFFIAQFLPNRGS